MRKLKYLVLLIIVAIFSCGLMLVGGTMGITIAGVIDVTGTLVILHYYYTDEI